MSPTANQLLSILDAMNEIDVEKSANFRMMGLLRQKLVEHFGIEVAEQIVSSMSIDLNDASVDEVFMDRASTSYADLIIKLHRGFSKQGFEFPTRAVVNCSKELSLTVKG